MFRSEDLLEDIARYGSVKAAWCLCVFGILTHIATRYNISLSYEICHNSRAQELEIAV